MTIQGVLYYNEKVYEKALTKTVGYIGKAKRAGDGGSPVRVDIFEDHFRAASFEHRSK